MTISLGREEHGATLIQLAVLYIRVHEYVPYRPSPTREPSFQLGQLKFTSALSRDSVSQRSGIRSGKHTHVSASP